MKKNPSLAGRLAALALLCLPLAVLAQGVDDAAFGAASGQFDRALKGDKAALDPALAAFQSLQQKAPAQPLYGVYVGASLAIKGREAWMPWNKLRNVELGLDQIDQALAALKPEHDRQLVHGVPVSALTRLTAASTFVALPDSIFHRRAQGVRLLGSLQADPTLAAAPEGFKASLAAQLARTREVAK